MECDPEQKVLRIETMERLDLIGKHVKLSNGQEGPIVFVEYEPPERVALVKTYPETPSPLTRVGVDRMSPPHLPYIVDIALPPRSPQGDGALPPRSPQGDGALPPRSPQGDGELEPE